MRVKNFEIYHKDSAPNTIIFLNNCCDPAKLCGMDIKKAYGNLFFLKSVEANSETKHLKITLGHEKEVIVCPFCGSDHKRIQKSEKRTVFDIFQFVCNVWFIWETEESIAAEVTYDNSTYLCMNQKCGKLYKIQPEFLPSPKMHYTSRVISYLKNFHFLKENILDFLKKLNSEVNLPISESTCRNILHGFPEIKEVEFESSDWPDLKKNEDDWSDLCIFEWGNRPLIEKLRSVPYICGIGEFSPYL